MTTSETQKSSPEIFSMGAHQTPEVGCFFLFSKMYHSCCYFLLASTEATAVFFIWDYRGYPPVRFEYRTASGGFLVGEILEE